MTDIGKTARPDVRVAGGRDLDLLLGPLVAYLCALEARSARWSGGCRLFR